MNRHALVTGGGTGLGLAITRRLVADGLDVTIVGRREQVLIAAGEELNSTAGRPAVDHRVADVTDPDAVTALAASIGSPLDVLVHNAGGNPSLPSSTPAERAALWLETYRLNVVSVVLVNDALLPHLRRPGRIVAISSVAALRGAGAYGAAKAAVNAWVTGLAGELASEQVTVNAVAPGFIPETEFWEGRRTPELIEQRTARIPMGRSGTPEEVAALVAHLAAPDAGFTTGQVIGIHGGAVLARS
ncbi:MAG: short-chain dehydrogenase [Marmoricola sp.]|nr:short-chain dehydrogenase [Marmoricola sp.]